MHNRTKRVAQLQREAGQDGSLSMERAEYYSDVLVSFVFIGKCLWYCTLAELLR